MILGFKQQFVKPILNGTKIHTIREDKSNNWQKGKDIHYATKKKYEDFKVFKTGICTSIQYIFMTYDWKLEISIGATDYCDKYLSYTEMEKLALNDGFNSFKEFEDWFYPLIKANKDEFYKGKIIHWTNFKY